jgi:hypothetical protein
MRAVWRRNDKARVVWRSGRSAFVRRAVNRLPIKKNRMARRAWSQALGWPFGWWEAPSARMTVFPCRKG